MSVPFVAFVLRLRVVPAVVSPAEAGRYVFQATKNATIATRRPSWLRQRSAYSRMIIDSDIAAPPGARRGMSVNVPAAPSSPTARTTILSPSIRASRK